MNEDARDALAFLGDHHVLSLALTDASGFPHACSLMYALDGFSLLWLSDPNTRHSQIIEAGGRVPVVATVAPDYADFTAIRGLQIFGTASRAGGIVESAAALARLTARYGFLAGARHQPGPLAKALAKSVTYRLTPERIVFVDNVRAFGSKTVLLAADLAL